MRHYIHCILLLLLMGITPRLHAQSIAVNTDLAMDVIGAPSLGVELTMGKKSTLAISGLATKNLFWNDQHIAMANPEWRVYISGRPMYHHYIGFTGVVASYKLHFAHREYHGDAAGAGLSFGYVWPISEHLNIDFHTSLGYLRYHHKEYPHGKDYDEYYQNSDGSTYTNSSGHAWVPINIGIKLAYIIK